MDAREVASRLKTLTKALIDEPPATVIKLLDDLKKAPSPTEETLRATKAGVTIGRLRSNANRDIARVANELVNKWKSNVNAAKDAAKKKMEGTSPNPKSAAATSSASPAPAPSSYGKPYEGDVNKRHYRNDKVDVNRTGNQTRDNTIGLLYNGLAFGSKESIEEVTSRAVEIEAAMFKAFKGSDNQNYRTKGRALFTALKRKDNVKLRRRTLSGEISADKFVVMSDKDLASEEQRAKDEELEKENMKKAQVPQAEKSISDQLKCGKCGQKKVSYTQAQTRSADEPMTTFCECTVCGNRWKFS